MRTGILAIALLCLATPLAADAQTGRIHRISYVVPESPEQAAYVETFRTAMRDSGYVDGVDLVVDVRLVDRELARLPAIVDELVAQKPDVLVAWESIAQVMRAKTASIPIVLAGAIDPVGAGLAHSLRRPGGNVTGVAQLNDVLPAKHIEILREIMPRLARVGLIVDTTASGCTRVEEQAKRAARSLGVVFLSYHVTNRADIEQAFEQISRDRPEALLPCPSPMLFSHRDLLFESSARLRIPFTSFIVANVPHGVLFAYAASYHNTLRRAATHVDKILKGAKPGDLPIEQPSQFELVVSLKFARTIGLTIPRSVLLRADRVVE